MNYLDLTAGQLACQFIKTPDSLLETFEQLLTALESFALGDEKIEVGFEGDDDFWLCDDPQSLLEDIEKALQMARRHSELVNRFCDDIDKGRGPSMKGGIRLIRLVGEGKKPTKSMVAEWHNWDSELRDYVEVFRESLWLDWYCSKEGLLARSSWERSETASPQPMAAANAPQADETIPAAVHNKGAAIDPLEKTHKTVRGTVVLESDLTRDERPCHQWLIILGYANQDHEPIPKTTFHNRIKGEGSNPLDAVLVRGQKYRLRKNQLPTAADTEAARNAIIEAVPPSKRGRKKEK